MILVAPSFINALDPNDIFVFGSNQSGIHGAGAAKFAFEKFGAVWGQGEGRFGQSYAIPTKDKYICTLPLNKIAEAVQRFFDYATEHPQLKFFVTEIGCGLAGYTPNEVAHMFRDAEICHNVFVPRSFAAILRS